MPEDVRELSGRVARLESILDAPLVAEALQSRRSDVEAQAWPGAVADGQVVTGAYISSIAASVQTWQGDVNANNFNVRYCASFVSGPSDGTGLTLQYEVAKARGVIQCWSGVWRQTHVIGADGEAMLVKNAADVGYMGLGYSSVSNGAVISSYNAGWRPLFLNSGAGGAYVVVSSPPTEPPDAIFATGTTVLWLDEAAGVLRFKVRYQNGVIHRGAITLT